MAVELYEEFNVHADLIAGRAGIFDIKVDDFLIYLKFETCCFPECGEVSSLIKTYRYSSQTIGNNS
ncbi:Rdx family protein [bacterium]|nr:Rdx family protein [bacterium]